MIGYLLAILAIVVWMGCFLFATCMDRRRQQTCQHDYGRWEWGSPNGWDWEQHKYCTKCGKTETRIV